MLLTVSIMKSVFVHLGIDGSTACDASERCAGRLSLRNHKEGCE
jgi:hypothetical protein